MDRATLQRLNMEAGKDVIAFYEPSDNGIPSRWTQADITSGQVELEAMELEAHKGPEVAQRFLDVALGDGLLIAEAARRWLATMAGKRQNQSLKGHSAALALLGRYLETEAGLGTLDGLALGQITRRLAGEFIAWRLSQTSMTTGRPISAATVQREFSAYSGLWKWAVTRGYVEANPWADQLTGIKPPAKHGDTGNNPEDKRAYSTAEIIAFLEATETTLAPDGGGYGATFFDLIRLLLLTGARPKSILSMSCGDIWGSGASPEAVVIRNDKTPAGRRVIPLHPFAGRVITARLASLPNTGPTDPLWPEVPAQGEDLNRAKTMSTRFVPVRRRILPGVDDVNLYSFRRTFATAAETSMHLGHNITQPMIALLLGHARGALSFDVYSEWSRLSNLALRGGLADRMAPLCVALNGIVETGLGAEVVATLEATAGNRPQVVRTAPAFQRLARK